MNVILMLFFGLLADAVHLAIAGGNTQPQKFISLFCLWSFFCWTRRSHYLLQIAANFLLVSLINECQTKVATYFTQTDCQGNNIVLLSSKIGGTFPPWNLKKAVAINFSGLFFFKIKPYKPWLLGKHGAIWFQREEACNDLDRSC